MYAGAFPEVGGEPEWRRTGGNCGLQSNGGEETGDAISRNC